MFGHVDHDCENVYAVFSQALLGFYDTRAMTEDVDVVYSSVAGFF